MIHRAIQRLFAFIGISQKDSHRPDPEGLLEIQKKRFQEKIIHFNRSLAGSEALCALLRKQIQELESKAQSLRTNLEAQARSETGAEVAVRLESCGQEIQDLRGQLIQAEDTREGIERAREAVIQEARIAFTELKGMLDEAVLQRALAELDGKHHS